MKIHMHVGQPKTGSSTIQRFLKNNRDVLIKKGYLYKLPNSYNQVSHQNILQKIVNSENPEKNFKEFIDGQIEKAREEKCDNIIISSESLFFMPLEKLEKLFSLYKDQLKIYVYLRRQDIFLESAWKQWHFKNLEYKDFDDYVKKYKIPDYYKNLKKWSLIVGRGSINVFAFEKRNFPNGLESHFLQSIGVMSNLDDFNYTIKDDGWGENNGLSAKGLELAFKVRELAENDIHNHSIQFFINRHFKTMQKGHFVNYNILSFEKRTKILQEHREINEKIRQEYLQGDHELFKDSIELDKDKQDVDKLNFEKIFIELFRVGIKQDKLIAQLQYELKKN